MRHPLVFCCAAILLAASTASARPASVVFAPAPDPSRAPLVAFTTGRACTLDSETPIADAVAFRFDAASETPLAAIALAWPAVDFGLRSAAPERQETPRRRPKAVEYSEGYEVRRRIHWYASFATAPLFAVEYALGQSLYNNPGGEGGKKGAHGVMAASIAGLFAANTVTGVWNLWEGRKDTNHRARRIVHGVLMIAADAGFVATGMLAPEGDEGGEHGRVFNATQFANDRRRHRTVALTSMATAAAGYVMMLIWR